MFLPWFLAQHVPIWNFYYKIWNFYYKRIDDFTTNESMILKKHNMFSRLFPGTLKKIMCLGIIVKTCCVLGDSENVFFRGFELLPGHMTATMNPRVMFLPWLVVKS